MPYVEAIASDAGDPKLAKALVDDVSKKYGRIDVLFVSTPESRALPPRLRRMKRTLMSCFASMFAALIFLIKHAAPVLSDGGSIILTSSIAAAQGNARFERLRSDQSDPALLRAQPGRPGTRAASHPGQHTITPGSKVNTSISLKMGLSPEQSAGFEHMAASLGWTTQSADLQVSAAARRIRRPLCVVRRPDRPTAARSSALRAARRCASPASRSVARRRPGPGEHTRLSPWRVGAQGELVLRASGATAARRNAARGLSTG